MYGLTAPRTSTLQARARGFADELIPLRGRRRAARRRAARRTSRTGIEARAVELGLYATNIPVELGGRGCTTLQQVLVQEQGGRVTNALAWCMTHAAGLVARGRQRPTSASAGCMPTVRGRARRSATRSPRRTPARTSPT